VHLIGSLDSAAMEPGIYAEASRGLSRKPLVNAGLGSIHQDLTWLELEPGGVVDCHLHAFEQAIYVLSGALRLEAPRGGGPLVADDYCLLPVGLPHGLRNAGDLPVRWLELSAPNCGEEGWATAFVDDRLTGGVAAEAVRRAHFTLSQMPEPSATIGLAGFDGSNVAGASLRMLVDGDFGASQFNMMRLAYVPGGTIAEHDHAFEEAFLFLEGEIEAVLDGETYLLKAGDYCWSGVASMHGFTNHGEEPVRWIETQVPQPPSKHQARFRGDWDRLVRDAAGSVETPG